MSQGQGGGRPLQCHKCGADAARIALTGIRRIRRLSPGPRPEHRLTCGRCGHAWWSFHHALGERQAEPRWGARGLEADAPAGENGP